MGGGKSPKCILELNTLLNIELETALKPSDICYLPYIFTLQFMLVVYFPPLRHKKVVTVKIVNDFGYII